MSELRYQRNRSIISNEKECFICGNPNVEKHHIFGGNGRRDVSDRYGCWVWLCNRHHTGSNQAVHTDKDLDLHLKCLCQRKWEERFGDRAEFIRLFTKSYLEE